jgi:FAD:protein FMN transferase
MTPLAHVDFVALGTTVRVVAAVPSGLDPAVAAVRRELDSVDLVCSRFRPDSELEALNCAGGRVRTVSELMLEALAAAIRAAALTDGAVTPTIGNAVVRLGYDRHFRLVLGDGPELRLTPSSAAPWSQIQLDRVRRTVSLPPGMRLDLDATAKALSVDRATAAAVGAAGCGVLVDVGGDLAVAGPPPPGGWPILVAESDRIEALGQLVSVIQGGVATSGIGSRRWRRGGEELHHLIDPSRGLPADGPLRTVTVAAGTCLDANIAATAAIVRRDGRDWLSRQGLPARLIDREGKVEILGAWPEDGLAA